MATDGKFQNAKVPVPRQSRHNLGNHWVGTLCWGRLHPIYVKDCSPGEVVHYTPNILVQTPAFASLTFAGIKVKQFSFFVPKRLLWKDFQSFIVGGSDGRSVWTPPKVYLADLMAACGLEKSNKSYLRNWMLSVPDSSSGSSWLDWYNALGLPLEVSRGFYSSLITSFGLPIYPQFLGTSDIVENPPFVNHFVGNYKVELMPFRAYQKVWWDWFRDSTLVPESLKDSFLFTNGGVQLWLNQQSSTGKTRDYINPASSQSPQLLQEIRSRNICYDKDYFTTARLSPQSGSPSIVNVPLPDSIPGSRLSSDEIVLGGASLEDDTLFANTMQTNGLSISGVTGNSSFNVETFRLANSLQRFLERSNVTGTRPLAQLLGRFGVAPSAARLDMAEFIGGTERTLSPQQVIATATTDAKQLGDRAAFGRLFYSAEKQTYRVNEHGIFISLLAIVPDVEYCDGLERMWTMDSKEDYFQPEYENLGYEAISRSELGLDAFTDSSNYFSQAWGYVPRYSWMKWKRSVLAGDFVRPDTSATNESWHSFRRSFNEFFNPEGSIVQPLNSDYVEVHANDGFNNWNRLFDVVSNDYDPFTVDVWNVNDGVLPMEGYVTPGLSSVYEMDGRRIRIPYGGFRM